MSKIKFSDSWYDIVKWVIAIVMPAVASLYGELGNAWGWYNPELIVFTITKVQLFLGTIFAISCYNHAQEQKLKDISDC